MPARIQRKALMVGLGKQADIATIAGEFLQFSQLNAQLATPNFETESDAAEIGKGSEFASNTFPTKFDPKGAINKYGSIEWATYAWAYALGNVQPGYTITPIDPGDSLELPYTTIVEQVAEGGGFAVDAAYVGCAIEEVMSEIKYGAGRATHTCNANWIGSGRVTTPSGVAAPGPVSEKFATSGSLQATILGVNYVTNKNILTIRQGWKNNLDPGGIGFFPGSGNQAILGGLNAQVRGRMFIGTRKPTFEIDAFLTKDSAELAAQNAQTEGSAVITLSFDGSDSITWTWPAIKYQMVDYGQTEGFVSVKIAVEPIDNGTDPLVTVTSQCSISGIAQ